MATLAAAAGLRELVVDKCLGVTDVGLAKVAVGCPRLEKLSVKWCREISDIGIELLAKKCPELRSVDISYLKVASLKFVSVSLVSSTIGLKPLMDSIENDCDLTCREFRSVQSSVN